MKKYDGIQIDVDKIYTYLYRLVAKAVPPMLLPPLTLREILEYIKRGMAQQPWLTLQNDPTLDIRSYSELL